MGITGTLLPLILGVITDCIKGAEVPLAQLGRLTHITLGFLLPYYHPKDPHTLAVFCSALVIICAVQGVFSYWTRQILIGLSRDIEYDLRNDLLVQARADGAGILRAQPHGRADVALHERFELGAHGARAGHHVQRQHDCDHGAGRGPDVLDFGDAQRVRAAPRADRGRQRLAVSAGRFTRCTEKFRRRSPCFPRRPRKIWPACASFAPTARKKRKFADSTRPTANTSTATCA